MKLGRRFPLAVAVGLATALWWPAAGGAAIVKLVRLASINGTSSQTVATTRSADGTLHMMFPTVAGAPNGLATISISPAGKVGPQLQALSSWQTTQPGLVVLPGGTLEAVFGAISPGGVSSMWGITSSDGGATWSAPGDVRSGSSAEVFDYASDLTAGMSGGTPVISLPHADLLIQEGLGAGAPTYTINGSFDGDAFDVDQATDAATGEVVDGWNSIATPGGNYLQGAAPSVGAAELVPGQVHDPLVFAARDSGPGVYAPYTTDGTHVRLLRYGGGTVGVGSHASVTATNLATATGPDGRIWVIWGQDGGADFAVTRSNKAVTRFEPIQLVDADTFSLWRIWGDGRLGPLDLFADEVPNTKTLVPPGLYYGRVLPVLSERVAVKKGSAKIKLKIKVTDAGDPVAGATVSAAGHKATTNSSGKAVLTGLSGKRVTVTTTAPGYKLLLRKVKL